MKKRIFSLALALLLAFALLPMAALAEGSEEPEQTAAEKVQALIDALPDADTVTAENRAEVEAQLTAIDEAKLALEDEERDALDYEKYNDAIAALNALDDMAGAEIPETLETEPEHPKHCVCGATHSDIGDHTSENVTTVWTGVSSPSEITASGNYYLKDNVTLSSQWTIANGTNIVLCLNGHTLTSNNTSTGDTILIEGTLTITDCQTTGMITGTDTTGACSNKVLVVSAVYSDCTLNLYGGTITGIHVGTRSGGGVHNEGTFNMYGGTITGNTAKNGGGVENYKNSGHAGPAVFNFYGGTISGNHATDQPTGNGVHNWINGTMNANGGTVEDTVYNQHGTIATTSTTSTTFEAAVTNGDMNGNPYNGTLSGGTYNGDVTNTDKGIITGGTYNANVTNSSKGKITGGTYNGNVTGNGTINESAQVTVTFDSNYADGTTPTKMVKMVLKGQKTTALTTAPTRTGYAFGGWYKEAACSTAFDFDTTAITDAITLYAKWTHVDHTGKATCQAKAICETCGDEYGEVNPANHTSLKHVQSKAATTEAEGNIEYWHCEDCDKYFSDKDGKTEIKAADTVIAKLTPEATATPAPTAKPQAPNTGDEANVALWLVLATVSVFGVAVVGRKKVR